MSEIIEVVVDPPAVIEVVEQPPVVIEVFETGGPPGPQGPPGEQGLQGVQGPAGDVSSAVVLNPPVSARNVIQATAGVVPLTARVPPTSGISWDVVPIQEWQDGSGAVMARLNAKGGIELGKGYLGGPGWDTVLKLYDEGVGSQGGWTTMIRCTMESTWPGSVFELYNDDPTAGYYEMRYRARGTAAAPTGVKTGDSFGVYGFRGTDSSNTSNDKDAARFAVWATGDWTPSSHPTAFGFYTAPVGASEIDTNRPALLLDDQQRAKVLQLLVEGDASVTGVVGGSAGGQGAQVRGRDGHTFSFRWTGTAMEIYVDGALYKTI